MDRRVRSWQKLLLFGLVALFITAVATTAIAGYVNEMVKIKLRKEHSPKTPNPDTKLPDFKEATSEEAKTAKEKVEKFLRKPCLDLKVQGIEKTPGGQMCSLAAGDDFFEVDMQTGEVCMAYFHSVSKRTTERSIFPRRELSRKLKHSSMNITQPSRL